MELLIVFAQSNRHVERTARRLAESLRRQNHAVYVADVAKDGAQILAPYDAVVIGTTMWNNRLDNPVRKYIKQNHAELMLKQVYLFVHTPISDLELEQALVKQLPAELLKHIQVFNLGLNMQRENLTALQFIQWKLRPLANPHPETDTAVDELVDIISEKRLDIMPTSHDGNQL